VPIDDLSSASLDSLGDLVLAARRSFRDADDWLAERQTEVRAPDWRDPDAGKVPFEQYAAAWIRERPLAQSTAELYGILLRVHLVPTFGSKVLAEITPAAVRAWRRARLDAGTGEPTVAKAYALLRTIMGTAVADDLIRRKSVPDQERRDHAHP
jgi:hypothetical protein